jgi:hypothetical protein
MSLDAVLKLKAPKMPKGLDDKEIDKALAKLEKDLAGFLAVAKTFSYEIGKFGPTVGEAEMLIVKKTADRNLDPAKKKAMEELYTAMKAFSKVFTNL